MRDTSDKYLRMKIFLAKIMGVAVLLVSMQFSQNGFGFKDEGISYIGWVLAIAVTIAQFVFNSKVKNLNWTITSLGIMAYIYSIWTNLLGFYNYQGKTLTFETLLDFNAILPVFASVFLDVFPEAILSWSFNSAGEGDLIGNIMAVGNDPDTIFTRLTSRQDNRQQSGQQNNASQHSRQSQSMRQSVPPSIPRGEGVSSQGLAMGTGVGNGTGTPVSQMRQQMASEERYPTQHRMRIPNELLPNEDS